MASTKLLLALAMLLTVAVAMAVEFEPAGTAAYKHGKSYTPEGYDYGKYDGGDYHKYEGDYHKYGSGDYSKYGSEDSYKYGKYGGESYKYGKYGGDYSKYDGDYHRYGKYGGDYNKYGADYYSGGDYGYGYDKKCKDCPWTLEKCEGECVNIRSNAQHCGSCNNECADNEVCVAKTCTCAEPFKSCPVDEEKDVCANLYDDQFNCGECGNVCGLDQSSSGGNNNSNAPFCVAGSCSGTEPLPCIEKGDTCTLGSQCCSCRCVNGECKGEPGTDCDPNPRKPAPATKVTPPAAAKKP